MLKIKIDFMRLQTLRSSPPFPSLVLSKSSPGQVNDTLIIISQRRSESHTCLEIDPNHPQSLMMSDFSSERPNTRGQLTGGFMEFPLAFVLSQEDLSHSLQAQSASAVSPHMFGVSIPFHSLSDYLHLKIPHNPCPSPSTSQPSTSTPLHHHLLLIVRPLSKQQL